MSETVRKRLQYFRRVIYQPLTTGHSFHFVAVYSLALFPHFLEHCSLLFVPQVPKDKTHLYIAILYLTHLSYTPHEYWRISLLDHCAADDDLPAVKSGLHY